jgi:hypothetical protein
VAARHDASRPDGSAPLDPHVRDPDSERLRHGRRRRGAATSAAGWGAPSRRQRAHGTVVRHASPTRCAAWGISGDRRDRASSAAIRGARSGADLVTPHAVWNRRVHGLPMRNTADRAPAHDRTVGAIRDAAIADAHGGGLTCCALLDEKTRSRGSYIGTGAPRCCASQIAVCPRLGEIAMCEALACDFCLAWTSSSCSSRRLIEIARRRTSHHAGAALKGP